MGFWPAKVLLSAVEVGRLALDASDPKGTSRLVSELFGVM
jgi:hypothetical protein